MTRANDSIVQQQLSALTSLTVGLTHLMASIVDQQLSLAEYVKSVNPTQPGLIATLSRIEQTQAALAQVRSLTGEVRHALRSSGLV